MGGRGASSGFVDRVPNADRATIADAKLAKYLLYPGKKHYNEFVAVGYSENNPERLKQDLLHGILNHPARSFEPNNYGARSFSVDMMLGVTHKAKFRTGWQIDKGESAPRFITAYRVKEVRK